jgi:hypothetical protein
LLQTGVTGRAGALEFEFGRMMYADPLGYIANGLFDGVKFTFYTDAGNFSAEAWNTGLLYKKCVKIEMTDDEWIVNNTPLDYGNFMDSYFAPRRVL